jgi:hypothetical protein
VECVTDNRDPPRPGRLHRHGHRAGDVNGYPLRELLRSARARHARPVPNSASTSARIGEWMNVASGSTARLDEVVVGRKFRGSATCPASTSSGGVARGGPSWTVFGCYTERFESGAVLVEP